MDNDPLRSYRLQPQHHATTCRNSMRRPAFSRLHAQKLAHSLLDRHRLHVLQTVAVLLDIAVAKDRTRASSSIEVTTLGRRQRGQNRRDWTSAKRSSGSDYCLLPLSPTNDQILRFPRLGLEQEHCQLVPCFFRHRGITRGLAAWCRPPCGQR
jgi:hypothetical protein